MTTAVQVANKLARAIDRVGETVVLKRRTGTGGSFSEVITKADQRSYSEAVQPTPQMKQADQEWLLSDVLLRQKGWTEGVLDGDMLDTESGTTRISKVNTERMGEIVISYTAWGRGD